jgi:hypothetical protein
MSYTEMYMVVIMPNGGSLPSIGSAAEAACRTDDTSFMDFICSTPEAESIRATFGEGAYSNYVDRLLEAREAETAKAARRAEQNAAARVSPTTKRAKIRKWFTKIREVYQADF